MKPIKEPVKRATPALLQSKGIGHLEGGNTVSDLNYQAADGPTRFLTSFTRRVYPLNLPNRSQSTEPYITPYQTTDDTRSLRPECKKDSLLGHRKHRSMAAEQGHRDTAEQEKLPVLRYATFRGDAKQREFGKSQFYEDFIVGGSNYNRGVVSPLYQPHLIPINPKTRLRLFIRLHAPSLRPIRPAHSTLKSLNPCTVSSSHQPLVPLPHDQDDVINYDNPAISFTDKMVRIQRLASQTIANLAQGNNGT